MSERAAERKHYSGINYQKMQHDNNDSSNVPLTKSRFLPPIIFVAGIILLSIVVVVVVVSLFMLTRYRNVAAGIAFASRAAWIGTPWPIDAVAYHLYAELSLPAPGHPIPPQHDWPVKQTLSIY